MDRRMFVRWLKINFLFFTGVFIVIFLLGQLFPGVTLELFERLRYIRQFLVEPEWVAPPPRFEFFSHILFSNGVGVGIAFIAGLLLLAPIAMMVDGSIHSLVLTASILLKRAPPLYMPILIATEASFLILTAAFASTLGAEIFGIQPERKQLFGFWRKLFLTKKLFYLPKAEKDWKRVFKENKGEFALFIITIVASLLFGAWFEVFIRL